MEKRKRNEKVRMDLTLLYKFFSGKASFAEAADVRRWAESDPANMRRFMEERKLFDSMNLLVTDGELETLSAGKTRRVKFRRVFVRTIAAASLAAAVFIAGWSASDNKVERFAGQTQSISVPAGQRLNMVLPDGTNVWLNSLSTIEYPVVFNGKGRNVKLDGQAYFEVKHDKSSPFTVETPKGTVKVTGTKFDVMSYSKSDEFETALMEGSVRVALNADPANEMLLTPNTKVALVDGDLVKTYVRDRNPYRWKEGLICFANAPFAEILKEFEKTYDVKVVMECDLGEVCYTGKFRTAEGLNYALRVLQKDIGFTYEEDLDNSVFYIR